MQLKTYQENAVEKLITRTKELMHEDLDHRTIVFQAPTGSGKTLMMAKYIDIVIEEFDDVDLCFVWVCIGKGDLHIQSYNSLNRYFDGYPNASLLEKSYFGTKETVGENEVVIVNWEKLRNKDSKTGEWKNDLMKDRETINFRELLKQTREDGREIILVIDESHSNSTSERALELRDKIVKPSLTIEMSATPILRENQYNEKVSVQSYDVINEGMIKKEIIINENIDEIDNDEISSQELIMQAAYSKRMQLESAFAELSVTIKPLVIIQLPQSEAGEDKKQFVELFLADKEITKDNGKLAVWLDKEKTNLEKLEVNDSNVEFLIFKQAIDTGWDCPRAAIIVRFREIKSLIFEIQTIGRILRMPEAKHYENDILNKGYVYTNVKSIEVKNETCNPNIIKSIHVKRNGAYKDLKLKSYYRNRIDMGDITSSFYKVFEKTFCDYFDIKINDVELFDINRKKLSEIVDIDGVDAKDEIILNKSLNVELLDELPSNIIEGEDKTILEPSTLMEAHYSQDDLYHVFESLIKKNLGGFASKRSVPTLKQALYNWFKKYINVSLVGNGVIYIQNIVLNNSMIFSKLFNSSIEKYKPVRNKEVNELIGKLEEWDDSWEIAENRNLNPNTHKLYNYKYSLYQPCYLKIDSAVEINFIDYMEKNNSNIDWWWQNGDEHMSLNFGVKYGERSTFQPDFIVKFKDGRLGIFDTKCSGYNEDDNKLKAEALQKYILSQNKNLLGGLVIKEGEHFRVNMNEHYISFEDNTEDWAYFDDILKSQ